MRTHMQPEEEDCFTGGDRGNGGAAPCSRRSLLFKGLASPLSLLLFSLLAASPPAAQAQGAVEEWVRNYGGGAAPGQKAYALAVGADGGVCVTGPWAVSSTLAHNVTIKYSSAGMPLWTNRYNEPGTASANFHAIALDASGNVYVAGYSGSPSDYVTIKYSSAGVSLWTNRYNGEGGSWDSANALALDANGNVFVTGRSFNRRAEPESEDFATVAYSSAGVPLWTNRYDGPGNSHDEARAVAVDPSGNVYVTGTATTSTVPYNTDFATIKYSNSGVPLWTNLYAGPAGQVEVDHPYAIAVDTVGNVFVTGGSSGGGAYVYATVAYSSEGVPLWTNHYQYYGPGNSGSSPRAVAVDVDGNLYVTGGSGEAYATIKYSGAGVGLWTNRGPRGTAMALAVDTIGTVFVTGYTEDIANLGSIGDYATIAYSSAGVPLWTNRYNGPGNREDGADAIGLGPDGSVYVTGSAYAGPGNFDWTISTVKYATPAVSIIRQPLSRTNAVGTTASFSVEATGPPPLSYKWRKEGVNLADGGRLSGVATTALAIGDVQPSDEGDYTVVVANEHGSATSTVAHLTVVVPRCAGRFTNLAYSPATGFSFIFRDGTVGQPYRIQRSRSAAAGSWSDWQSITYHGPVGLMDMEATGADRRFYRAVSP